MIKVAVLRLIDLLKMIDRPIPWAIMLVDRAATCDNITCHSDGYIDIDGQRFKYLEDAARYINANT